MALYAYEAQTDQELSANEGDLLYLLETSDTDDWWKVKKRVPGMATEEPVGLVPKTYIEPAPIIGHAKALYDYDKQTEEELSFAEGALFDVYDESDADWVLVRNGQEYGFVPANYISKEAGSGFSNGNGHAYHSHRDSQHIPVAPPQPAGSTPLAAAPTTEPVYAYGDKPLPAHPAQQYPPQQHVPSRSQDYEEEEDAPPLPSRPRPTSTGGSANDSRSQDRRSNGNRSPGRYDNERRGDRDRDRDERERERERERDRRGSSSQNFLTWNIQEVDGRKKHKATLAIGNGTVMFSPERSSGVPSQWDGKDMLSYSSEKKHVFLEFQHPRTSLDLHAGSKEVAAEICSALGELAGAVRSTGLKEIYAAANSAGQKMGRVMYDFESQGNDEVNAKEGDHVIIIDDKRSSEWWIVRNANGEEGVMPASYLEVLPDSKKLKEAWAKEEKSNRRSKRDSYKDRDRERDRDRDHDRDRDRDRRKKPDMAKVRTWTDRSGTFKVDAALLGCADGNIHLHKLNGVKIAVAASKMSLEDLEFVESVTGVRLDDDKPLVDIRRRASRRNNEPKPAETASGLRSSSSISLRSKASAANNKPDFDWFGFFLECGVDVNNCQRYSINFTRDQMDENVLEDISPAVLRNLGLKEGDILRVTKKLDEKYNRKRDHITEQVTGSLFTGPDGTLRNNTKNSAASMSVEQLESQTRAHAETLPQSPVRATASSGNLRGFDDDAWSNKGQRQQQEESPAPVKPPRPSTAQSVSNSPATSITTMPARPSSQPAAGSTMQPQPTGALRDLLGIAPLQPQKTAENLLAERQMRDRQILLHQQQQLQQQHQQLAQQQQQILTGLSRSNTGNGPLIGQNTGAFLQSTNGGLIGQNTGGFLQSTGGMLLNQQTGPQGGLYGQQTGPQGGLYGQQTGPSQGQVLFGQQTGPNQGLGQGQGLFGQQTGPSQGQVLFGQQTGPGQVTFGQQTGSMNNSIGGTMGQQVTGGSLAMMGQQRTGGSMGPFATGNSAPTLSQLQAQQTQQFQQNLFGGGLQQTQMQPQAQMQQQQQQQPFNNIFGQQNYSTPSLTQSFGQMSLNNNNQLGMMQQQQPQGGVPPSMSPGNPMQPLQGQPTGFGFGNSPMNTAQQFMPLQPQKTGPHPPVSFGGGQPLQFTPTGRRANLSQASASNPFGF